MNSLRLNYRRPGTFIYVYMYIHVHNTHKRMSVNKCTLALKKLNLDYPTHKKTLVRIVFENTLRISTLKYYCLVCMSMSVCCSLCSGTRSKVLEPSEAKVRPVRPSP